MTRKLKSRSCPTWYETVQLIIEQTYTHDVHEQWRMGNKMLSKKKYQTYLRSPTTIMLINSKINKKKKNINKDLSNNNKDLKNSNKGTTKSNNRSTSRVFDVKYPKKKISH
nr:unnamed protein product [Haemonchus contortus]